MAAYGCMRALSTVLDSVSSMSALFPELEAILFPLMQRLTSTEGQDVFEEVLELISYFTYFSPSVSTLQPSLLTYWDRISIYAWRKSTLKDRHTLYLPLIMPGAHLCFTHFSFCLTPCRVCIW